MYVHLKKFLTFRRNKGYISLKQKTKLVSVLNKYRSFFILNLKYDYWAIVSMTSKNKPFRVSIWTDWKSTQQKNIDTRYRLFSLH